MDATQYITKIRKENNIFYNPELDKNQLGNKNNSTPGVIHL